MYSDSVVPSIFLNQLYLKFFLYQLYSQFDDTIDLNVKH